jgi:pyrroline-5-carboxylate reductase
MTNLSDQGPLWLIGAGNMGGAMLRGWLAAGLNPAQVTVIDPYAAAMPAGVTVLETPPPDGAAPSTVVLAIKPQLLDVIVSSFASAMEPETLLVSILAGVEIASLRSRFPAPNAVLRVMPNLPVAVGKGVMALNGDGLTDALTHRANALMTPLGLVEWISDESLFDAVTAVSGCGPAFLFRFIEALGEAGAALGLPHDQAARLALATVEGSACFAAASDEAPGLLADRVASPGGSTREGLNVLDGGKALKSLLNKTLEAAARRSAELAAIARV